MPQRKVIYELQRNKISDAKTQTYLGSPSIVRLADGTLLATHDYLERLPLNHEHEEHLTSVYHSDNDGGTWVNLTHIANAFWSSLFVHNGSVYLLGTSQQYGSIVSAAAVMAVHMDPPQGLRNLAYCLRRSVPRTSELPLRARSNPSEGWQVVSGVRRLRSGVWGTGSNPS